MSGGSRPPALNMGRSLPSQCVIGVIVTITCFGSVTSRAAKTDIQQYSVVARVGAKSAGLTSRDIIVRVGKVSVPATDIQSSPDVPRNIAIVMDTGPHQANVLSKEKELAVALINALSNATTSFTIASAGAAPDTKATTLDRSVAIDHVREIAGDSGEKSNVPIYDGIGSAIRQISFSPGLRVIIFIGEGNDGGSRLRYADLLSLAESFQVSFSAALVADHSLRGTKSILRYGWNLRDLASDTAGIFLENQEPSNEIRQLSESVQDLRLIAFEMPTMHLRHSRVSVSVRRGKRLPAQKTMVVP